MHPMDILRFAKVLFPNLYQTTAFGLTGLATIDMLAKLQQQDKVGSSQPVDLIFLDTLYHFPETLELVEEVRRRYSLPIHVYKPFYCESVEDFERMHGQKLWEADEDSYDYLVKVRERLPLLPN